MTARKTPGQGSAPENNQPPGAKAPGGFTPAREPSPSVSPSSVPDSVPQQGGEEEERVQAELQDLVSGLERERDEYLALARRTKADFENYRKRVSREASQAEAR